MSTALSGGGYRVFNGLGNTAETLDFRAIGSDLVTPVYQQWNIGLQLGLGRDMAWEVRYNGSVGNNLLESVSFNAAWDLNDPETPQPVKHRITQAFRAGGGTASAGGPNALNPATGQPDGDCGSDGRLIPAEVRARFLSRPAPIWTRCSNRVRTISSSTSNADAVVGSATCIGNNASKRHPGSEPEARRPGRLVFSPRLDGVYLLAKFSYEPWR